MTTRPKKQKAAAKHGPTKRPELPGHDAEATSPEQWVAVQERNFAATRNPIYVWQALDSLNFQRFNAAIERGGWKRGDPLVPLVLPEWCTRYLMQVARKIDYLSQGLDDRRRPKRGVTGGADDRAEESWYANPTLDAKAALKHLPASLLFTRAGWNAFRDFWRTERKLLIDDARQELRGKGMSTPEILGQMLHEYGLEDERTVRRYTADARRVRQGKVKSS